MPKTSSLITGSLHPTSRSISKATDNECTVPNRSLPQSLHSFTLRNLSAFVITDTELKLMAAAAKMGLSSRPKKG